MSCGSSFKTLFLYTLYKSNQEILFAKWERGGEGGSPLSTSQLLSDHLKLLNVSDCNF